jgi:hypothetical protein
MMICPDTVKSAVFTVISPVTQQAETEVKKASISGIPPSSGHTPGKDNRTVPAEIIIKK